jgi:hypothetical protein
MNPNRLLAPLAVLLMIAAWTPVASADLLSPPSIPNSPIVDRLESVVPPPPEPTVGLPAASYDVATATFPEPLQAYLEEAEACADLPNPHDIQWYANNAQGISDCVQSKVEEIQRFCVSPNPTGNAACYLKTGHSPPLDAWSIDAHNIENRKLTMMIPGYVDPNAPAALNEHWDVCLSLGHQC